jgi:hypothetical protein
VIARLALSAVLLQITAAAQLQLFQYIGTVETPVTGGIDAGTAAPGDTLNIVFAIRNTGLPAATVQTINVAGYEFQLSAQPLLPSVLATQAEALFTVAFSPTTPGLYSAVITVNTIGVTITASAIPEALLSFGGTQLPAGATADFGQIQWGTSIAKTFTLSNPNSTAVTVGAIVVNGAAFQGPAGIAAPLLIPAGGSTTFQIFFAPKVSGQATGTLTIDRRTFQLTGLGLVPPLPKGAIIVNSQTAASAQQLSVTISLASVSQVAGNGTLTLAFEPATGLPDDPAIQFLSGPLRNASVSITPGDSFARIDGQPNMAFQTGATAGTLVFTLTLPNSSDQFTLPIAPAPVSVTSSSGDMTAGVLDVNIAGFDNTYSISQLSFTFYDNSSNVIQPGVISVNAASQFHNYFAATQAGGMFTMLATFPFTGNSGTVAGVNVQIANSVGTITTQRIAF